MTRGALFLAAVVSASAACGNDATLVVVVVELNLTAPAELDELQFHLSDDGVLFAERSFVPAPGEPEPWLELYPSGSTPDEFDIEVAGLLAGSVVARSDPIAVRLREGSEVTVRISLSPLAPPMGTEGPHGDATCADGVDNDRDGETDGDDRDCMDVPTAIYRSVGPGTTAALASGSSGNPLTVVGSTALFASDLPDRVGVGDALVYAAGGSQTIAFIHERQSAVRIAVRTASGGFAPDTDSPDTGWSLYRAYTSLVDAEEGVESSGIPAEVRDFELFSDGADLVGADQQWNIACYADAVDDAGRVSIYEWTTGPDNYLRVFTPTESTEVGVSQRHGGVVGGGYVLQPAMVADNDWYNVLAVVEEFVRVEGLELSGADVTNPDSMRGVIVSTSETDPADVRLDALLIHDIWSADDASESTASGAHIQYGTRAALTNSTIFEITCLSANSSSQAYGVMSDPDPAGAVVILYNNTVFDIANPSSVHRATGIEAKGDQGTVAKNNVVFGVECPGCTSRDYRGWLGGFISSTNNASTDDTAPGDSPKSLTGSAATDYLLGSGDVHLDPMGTHAGEVVGQGADLSADAEFPFAVDLDGEHRPAGAWDVGADQTP